ncbi:MAG: TetR/AcrR family transcriptional regulator [Terracidiphilus sp.]|nr:TetR/AcrR family transcriptional regulator [Terracidiphilus sp.]
MVKSHKNANPAPDSPRLAVPQVASPVGRRQRRAAETRVRIFRAATQLIADRGLNGVTVEQITEAADVGKGTFFNYFPTKEHVLGVMAELQSAKIEEAAAAALQGNECIHDILQRMVQRLAGELGRTQGLLAGIVSAIFASESVRELIRNAFKRNLAIMAKVIVAGQQRGEIDPELNGKVVATQMVGTCWGTVLMWALLEEGALAGRIDETFQLFWRSIAVGGGKQAL